jgi:hypothetical protein
MCQHDVPASRAAPGPGEEGQEVRPIRLRRAAAAGATLALAAGLGACVDHDSNAEKFCEKNAELLLPASDRINYSEDVARFVSDELEKTMRYAGDATRDVRLAARDMSDAYLKKASLAADDDATTKEMNKNQAKLIKAREDAREACGEFLEASSSDS